MNTLPDCRLVARKVYQLQVGDRAGVDSWALLAQPDGRPFLAANAEVGAIAAGRVIVSRETDGLHVDLAQTDTRAVQFYIFPIPVLPVVSVANAGC